MDQFHKWRTQLLTFCDNNHSKIDISFFIMKSILQALSLLYFLPFFFNNCLQNNLYNKLWRHWVVGILSMTLEAYDNVYNDIGASYEYKYSDVNTPHCTHHYQVNPPSNLIRNTTVQMLHDSYHQYSLLTIIIIITYHFHTPHNIIIIIFHCSLYNELLI